MELAEPIANEELSQMDTSVANVGAGMQEEEGTAEATAAAAAIDGEQDFEEL
jgi:hypothetical protein